MNIMNNLKVHFYPFKISDIFVTNGNQVPTGAYIKKNELILGNTPRITVRDTNNGVDSYCESNSINYRLYKNFISVSFLGSVFYHPYKASIDMKVHALMLKDKQLNKYLAEYFKVVIKANTQNFSYGNQLSSKDLPKLKIMLPVLDNGKPDYEYMENCIKEILGNELQFAKKYCSDSLLEIKYNTIKKLNEKHWHEFSINDIFLTVQRGKRLKKGDHKNGNIPYISSTMMNNGIDGFIGNKDGKKFYNCLTIANSGSVGSSFYHQYEFVGSDHITAFENKKFNKYIYLFLSVMISRIGSKYSFNREINDFRISNEKILLPVNDKMQPDYEYMEQYIKNIMYNQYKKYLYFLTD